MNATWTLRDRAEGLARLAREGTELVVIGGGITGAGILRDAALRGLGCALFERTDFAAGTSSHTSKMIHGGLRYIAEGQLGVTRESCVERAILARLNPHLVRPLPFLFCAFEGGVPPWKMLAGLSIYAALANFRGGAFRVLDAREIDQLSHDVRKDILRAAALYHDQQVDDARLVLETVKDARRAGAEAIHHAEVIGFDKREGKLTGVHVRDLLTGESHRVRAERVVNAAGPAVDRLRALDTPRFVRELRPAKGVHVVIDRARVHADAAVAFQAVDGRHMFLCPYGDVHLIGTTDTFTEEIDEPTVSQADVDYLLASANRVLSCAPLTSRDVLSVFAGVRPLVAEAEAAAPSSRVSREHRITEDPSGLISVAGGKLTTHRRMAEQIVDKVAKSLPTARRRALGPCSTHRRPLRAASFDASALTRELTARYGLEDAIARRLLSTWGEGAVDMLAQAPASHRAPIGASRFLFCEVARAFTHECAATLCDVLERRVRVAAFARGQGLTELEALAQVAAEAMNWGDAQMREEMQRYREVVARRYQVHEA